MKKKQQPLPVMIDIKDIESRLPVKRHRSHHEVVKIKNVHKSFDIGRTQIAVLKNINIVLYSGEFVIVYGPSGCGK